MARVGSRMTGRHYVFTVFNQHETEADCLALQQRLDRDDDVRYAIFQLERCDTTGRLHVQGYLEFKGPCRPPAAKRAIGNESAHVEKRRGSRQEARDYARKEETRVCGPFEVRQLSRHILHLSDW